MSTEFRSAATGELMFVRWSGRSADITTAIEFGTITNFEYAAAARAGDTFLPIGMPLDDDPASAADLVDLVTNGRATFGQFPVTVEVGSGEMWRFTVKE
ncbi:hypothetical protein [Amycolatopsis sp. NPDC058986]|uniref:hypothetical protein n=1 Tax=unclassified Amycolatopsis TaxID=2618356 RepID=UPI00366FB470